MKRKVLALMLLLVNLLAAIMLCGCSKQRETTVSSGNYDINQLNFSGESDDNQSYWNIISHNFAKGANGYYYLANTKDTNYLYYIDDSDMTCVPLCGKAQCDHHNNNCDANFIGYNNSVWCYQNYLYLIKNENGKEILVRVNPDGTNRTNLFEIGNKSDLQEGYGLTFCEDSVFIYNRTGNILLNDESDVILRKRTLDGKQDYNIYVDNTKDTVIDSIKSYEDKVFFIVETTSKDEDSGLFVTKSKGVYCYDNNTNTVGNVLDDNICDYAIDTSNNIIYYYVIGEGLYQYEIKKKSIHKIFDAELESQQCQVSYDGNYLYLNNEKWMVYARINSKDDYIWVLDNEGKILNQIKTPGVYSSFFGDKKYLFFKTSKEKDSTINGYSDIGYIRKDELETVDTWTVIK